MVDLLRMFRRRAPSRGKQGFGRAKGDIKSDIKGDITSFSARMGDMFKGGKSDPAPQPASRQPFQLTEQQQQWASYSEMAVMLTEDDVTSFERTSPPIPRGDARRPPQPESRQAQQRQPQQRPPQQGRAAAQRSQPRAGYLAVHGIEKSFGTRKVVRGINIYVRRG